MATSILLRVGMSALMLSLMFVACWGFYWLWMKLDATSQADLAILITSCLVAPLLALAMWSNVDPKGSSVNVLALLPYVFCAMVSHEVAMLKKRRYRGICILGLCITIPCNLLATSIGLFMLNCER